MAKRKNGEGCWGVKTINGIKYQYFKHPSGKWFYGKTQKEVKEKIKKYENQEEKITIHNKTIFGDYVMNWLKNVKSKTVRESTLDGYVEQTNIYIINYKDYDLCNKQLRNINQKIIEDYLETLANNFSRGTIKRIFTIIKQCLNYAEIKGDIDSAAFLTKVVVPTEDQVTTKKKEIQFLEKDDMIKLYHESKRINTHEKYSGVIGEPFYSINAQFVIFIMYTGVRVGECLALKWKDVDLERKLLHVRRNLVVLKDDSGVRKRLKENEVKTQSGARIVPLCPQALEMLEEFRKVNPNHKPNDYIAIGRNGNKLLRKNIANTLHKMLINAGCNVAECSPHALRHTFGSFLLLNGVDIKVVSTLLGHKDVTTTYNIYIHIIQRQTYDAVQIFNTMENM